MLSSGSRTSNAREDRRTRTSSCRSTIPSRQLRRRPLVILHRLRLEPCHLGLRVPRSSAKISAIARSTHRSVTGRLRSLAPGTHGLASSGARAILTRRPRPQLPSSRGSADHSLPTIGQTVSSDCSHTRTYALSPSVTPVHAGRTIDSCEASSTIHPPGTEARGRNEDECRGARGMHTNEEDAARSPVGPEGHDGPSGVSKNAATGARASSQASARRTTSTDGAQAGQRSLLEVGQKRVDVVGSVVASEAQSEHDAGDDDDRLTP